MDIKNKKKFIGLGIVLVIFCLMGVSFFLNREDEKPLDNGEINDKQNVEQKEEEDIIVNVNLDECSDWLDYILKTNIKEIQIVRYVLPKKSDAGLEKLEADLTKEQLKEIFDKFKNFKLTKQYLVGHGSAGGDTLNVYYKEGENDYILSVYEGMIYFGVNKEKEDKKLLTMLEKTEHNVVDENLSKETSVFIYKFDDTYSKSVYDNYFKKKK